MALEVLRGAREPLPMPTQPCDDGALTSSRLTGSESASRRMAARERVWMTAVCPEPSAASRRHSAVACASPFTQNSETIGASRGRTVAASVAVAAAGTTISRIGCGR